MKTQLSNRATSVARLIALVWAIGLLSGCDKNLPFEPSLAAGLTASSGLTATAASASQINLSWQDNSPNETGFEIHRSTTGPSGTFALLAKAGANVTSYSNGGLTATTQYCYKVRTFKSHGSSTTHGKFSNVACATTLGPPPAPSSTSAAPKTSTIVDVRWTDNTGSEHGFRVERSADFAGPWMVAGTVGMNITAFSDAGRTAEQAVCYRVIATNPYGESAPSEVDCTAPPNRPTQIATSANGSIINVTWTDASNVEDGYEVQRARDDLVWAAIANLPAGATSYSDASITPDARMWYRVRAKKDGGFSDFSDHVWSVVATRAPDAPSLIAVAPGNSTSAAVQWGNVSATATAIRIERSVDGQATWATAASVPVAEDTRFWDNNRTPEEVVCYRVFASNSYGESGSSGVDCTVPPAGPTNLSSYSCGDGCSVITWSDNSSVEERYELYYTYCYSESECYWGVRYLPANTDVTALDSYEYFNSLYAYSDGGYSDAGTLATSAAMPVSRALVVRPTNGARAPRPPVSRVLK